MLAFKLFSSNFSAATTIAFTPVDGEWPPCTGHCSHAIARTAAAQRTHVRTHAVNAALTKENAHKIKQQFAQN